MGTLQYEPVVRLGAHIEGSTEIEAAVESIAPAGVVAIAVVIWVAKEAVLAAVVVAVAVVVVAVHNIVGDAAVVVVVVVVVVAAAAAAAAVVAVVVEEVVVVVVVVVGVDKHRWALGVGDYCCCCLQNLPTSLDGSPSAYHRRW
jgi:hypothetical protein